MPTKPLTDAQLDILRRMANGERLRWNVRHGVWLLADAPIRPAQELAERNLIDFGDPGRTQTDIWYILTPKGQQAVMVAA